MVITVITPAVLPESGRRKQKNVIASREASARNDAAKAL